MIFFVSGFLLCLGLLLLAVQAIRIAFSLLKLCCYLIALAVMLPVTALLGLCVFVQWCARMLGIRPVEAEPVITINVYSDEEDAPTIELRKLSQTERLRPRPSTAGRHENTVKSRPRPG
jgi:hypothetical protein